MRRSVSVLLAFAAVFACCGSLSAGDLALTVRSFTLDESGIQDVLGAGTSLEADGKADAVFTLSVTGAQAIKQISVTNETSGKIWSTSPADGAGPLLVRGSDGSVLNRSSRMIVTPVVIAASFTLYINDAASAIPKDSKMKVTVTMIDGKEATGSATVKKQAAAAEPAPSAAQAKPDGKSEILLFESMGTGGQDLAGNSEKIGGDEKADCEFKVRFFLKNTAVKGLKVAAKAGDKKAVWDTVPGNKAPLAVMLDGSKNIVNRADGSVSFQGDGESAFLLLVCDKDGILSKQDVKVALTATLSDGSILEKEAVRGKKIAAKDGAFAEYRGAGKYDFVGQSKKMGANMTPDRFISVTVNTSDTLRGVKIKDTVTGRVWDTIPDSKNLPIAVLTAKGEKLNKPDGSVSVVLDGASEVYLAFDEEDEKAKGPYRITMSFVSGRLIEADAGKAAAKAQPEKGAAKADRRVEFVSAKPAVVPVDVVGKNKKIGASGAKDTAITIKVSGRGRIKAMVFACGSGKGWDTLTSNNGRWLLGVRDNAGKLLNTKKGSIAIEVNGTKKFQLVMQDNGKLRGKNGKFLLTTTWGDGEVTETEYKW